MPGIKRASHAGIYDRSRDRDGGLVTGGWSDLRQGARINRTGPISLMLVNPVQVKKGTVL